MTNRSPVLSSYAALIAGLLLLGVCRPGFAAVPIPLPGAATPGGAAPHPREAAPTPAEPPNVFLIPPVMDRPLGLDEGQRLLVRGFTLRGVIDHPQYGIYADEVRGIVEQLRRSRQKMDNTSVVDGFTDKELAQGAALLRGLVDRPSDQLGADDIARIKSVIDKLRSDKLSRSLTIGRLQQIANEVTRYYRRRGFILARAYIPAQTVVDQMVVIQVIEGTLERVTVENNKRYGSELLQQPFAGMLGKPVVKGSIEGGLLRLTDYPGLTVFGVLKPGSEAGGSVLGLNVQRERAWEATLHADNYGSKYTGEYRLGVDAAWNNPTGAADMLSAHLIQTFSPNNGHYGSLNYQRPVFGAKNSVGIGYAHYAFDLGADLAALGIQGTSDIADLYYRRSFARGRQFNNHARLSLSRKVAKVKPPIDSTDNLTVISLEYGFDSVDTRHAGVNSMSVQLAKGIGGLLGAMAAKDAPDSSRHGADGKQAGGDFAKLFVRFQRLQTLTRHQTLLLNINGQYSPDLLTSVEQLPLGGPGSVRAYPVSQLLVDKGVAGSLEWDVAAPGFAERPAFFNRTWGDILQLAVFADGACGWLNKPLSSERGNAYLRGMGVGLRFAVGAFNARLDMARPIGSAAVDAVDQTQFYGEMSYHFW